MTQNSLPFFFPLSSAEIIRRRAKILAVMLAMDKDLCAIPVRHIGEKTLGTMLALYNELFFSGFLTRAYGHLAVTLSSRLTSSAGKFIYARNAAQRMQKAEIRMSSDFLYRLADGPFHLNGLSVATAQEAFLVVFEHEVCHAAETALFGGTGHSKRFLTLANGLFGHTDTRHSLPTRMQEARQEGLQIGQQVFFPYKGSACKGFISYIGKSATVMVPMPRGPYRDQSGRRYAKYRVPLSLLKKHP